MADDVDGFSGLAHSERQPPTLRIHLRAMEPPEMVGLTLWL
jgi:hypothetical protein